MNAWLYDAIRSPRTRAKPDGGLNALTPQALLTALYEHLSRRNDLDPATIGEVILGCVTQHGEQAANIARTSLLHAGWPAQVGGLTVNRFCSSGLDAVGIAALKVGAGLERAVVAGGVEMMSRVPMLSDEPAAWTDPALAARCHMLLMGSGADLVATLAGITREDADALALQSQQRAAAARREGRFSSVVPVARPGNDRAADQDECIREQLSSADLAALPPAFATLGANGADATQLAAYPELARIEHIHTAGNSPAMCDGAALVLVGDEALAGELGRPARARIVHSTQASGEPLQVLTGCLAAARRLLSEQKLGVADIDLFEVHEAFAAPTLLALRELDVAPDRFNVNGGVIALGHPMGATGTIMLGTLLDELERRDLETGLVAVSGAAGCGSAMLVRRC